MISLPKSTDIYLYSAATDLRKSFDGLSGIVRSQLGREPTDGSLFLFLNRQRTRIKILYWDRDGLVVWYKRLEAGTFENLVKANNREPALHLDATELTLLLAGVSCTSAQRRKRFTPNASNK